MDYNYSITIQFKGVGNLKNQKKFIAAVIVLNIFGAAAISSAKVKAETDYVALDNLVNIALSEKNLFHYNSAYGEIMKLQEGYERDLLLSRLAAITGEVWTKDITELVQLFEVMGKQKSGREYDALEARIKNSSIKDIDKQYLYHELHSWGKDTVWTDDYKKAIAAVIKVWNDKTKDAALEADNAVNELKVQLNKEYLTEQLKEAKIGVGLLPVILDSKYFDDTLNAVYVGTEKSINLDLSSDTKERTVTLKGKFKDLHINAPLATVILEDVDAKEIILGDVASHSLYLKGNTKVQSLIINDKNDNAHVVLQGKAVVGTAEVKSGAKIEANNDAGVESPFGKLVINTDTKKAIELSGDFKASVVQVERPVELKVAASIDKIEVEKDAKDTVVTVAKEGKIKEVSAQAALKVEGTGTLGEITGPASKEVVNKVVAAPPVTPPVTPGNGGGTTPIPGGGSTPAPGGSNPPVTPPADTTPPKINNISVTIGSRKVDINPANTGVLDLTAVKPSSEFTGSELVNVKITLDSPDTTTSVNAILDFTGAQSVTLQEYDKVQGTLSYIQNYLSITFQLASIGLTPEQFKKITGTTLTLIDAAGNRATYQIVIN